MQHKYFGTILEDEWSGYYPEAKTFIPYFETEVTINLGAEFDEDGEEVTDPPTESQLDEFASTLDDFLANIDRVIIDIQQSAFEHYQKIHAKYYEKPFEVLFDNSKVQRPENGELHSPLSIDTKEKHFEYMKKLHLGLRVEEDKKVRIPIYYSLDEEHGLEVILKNNKVIFVGGIAEYYDD